MKWRVLISCPHLQTTIDNYRDLFAKHDVEIELPDVTQQLNESELLNIIDRKRSLLTPELPHVCIMKMKE